MKLIKHIEAVLRKRLDRLVFEESLIWSCICDIPTDTAECQRFKCNLAWIKVKQSILKTLLGETE